MNIGIIGFGSMGKMLAEKFADSDLVVSKEIYISNRSFDKICSLSDKFNVCRTNVEVADTADILFLCVRPVDIKGVLEDIKDHINNETLVVSLNGSISFELIETVLTGRKIAKTIPSVTAEINKSQTLICYNSRVGEKDKQDLERLLKCMGNIIELPENEIGMGSELVSCMPGFISAIFDVICTSAKKHTAIPEKQAVDMVLNTLIATAELMTDKGMNFNEVVSRVATKGGITEVGTKVIYDKFSDTADELFEKTLEKRALTAKNAESAFDV